MDRERLFKVIGEKYIAKNELYGYLPLGVNADEIWGTVLEQRRAKAIALPLTNAAGQPYWYTLTDKMIIASENIVNELFEHNVDKPLSSIMSIREIYFTGYLEGAQISVQDAMSFLQSGEEPHDVEELMILNNRQAGSFAAENIYRPLNEDYIKALAQILTNGLDNGGGELRTVDSVEIYSMQGENYVLPSAARLSGCVKEISSFLADLSVHPLIKSAVAQAWTMVVRPFPEGNERLGRLLSEIILVRSGYTFFGEDSVSAVIAKSGFKYFDSIAKSIRSDNGGDLTYFLEYYLSVLSSYADNNRYKRRKHESEIIRSEQMLASEMMLSKCSEGDISHEAAIQDINQKNNNGIVQGISNKLQGFMMSTSYRKKKNVFNILIEFLQSGKFVFTTSDISEHCKEIISAKIIHSTLSKIEEKGIIKVSRKPGVKNYYEFVLTNKVPRENGTADDETYSYDAIYNEIDRFRVSMSENSRRISAVLIDYLKSGKMTFTMADLKEESGLTRMNINNFIRKFILSGMILHNDNGFSFNLIRKDEIADSMTTSQYVIDNYSSEVLLLVHELCTSTLSTKKDRRIGKIIRSCFEKGIITTIHNLRIKKSNQSALINIVQNTT